MIVEKYQNQGTMSLRLKVPELHHISLLPYSLAIILAFALLFYNQYYDWSVWIVILATEEITEVT